MVQKARPGSPSDLEDKRARALTDAALSAAKRLGLGSTDLASILGVAEGAVAAMRKGERAVDGVNGEAERADALAGLYHAVAGGDDVGGGMYLSCHGLVS